MKNQQTLDYMLQAERKEHLTSLILRDGLKISYFWKRLIDSFHEPQNIDLTERKGAIY